MIAHPTEPAPVAQPARGRTPFLARYGRFFLVGLTGVVVNLIVFALVLDALTRTPGIDVYGSLLRAASTTNPHTGLVLVASAVAFGVATLWNFGWNSVWTFRSTVGHRHPTHYRLALYYGVSLGSLAVNELVLFGTSFVVAPLYGQAAGILLGSIIGFVGNQRFTFAERAVES